MPLYDYACRDCEHTFEELVFDDEQAVECPECHGGKVERQLSLPAKPLPMTCDPKLPPCGPGCCRL
jgi:putative FmdB family regulatory protein